MLAIFLVNTGQGQHSSLLFSKKKEPYKDSMTVYWPLKIYINWQILSFTRNLIKFSSTLLLRYQLDSKHCFSSYSVFFVID